jgi:uncharacterized protein (DUF58 family)
VAKPTRNCCCFWTQRVHGFQDSGGRKLDYARYVAASLAYLAGEQRDATGLIVFDEDVKNYIAPSTARASFPSAARH